MPVKASPLEHSPRMSRGEMILCWVYLPFYLIGTPLLISLLFQLLGRDADLFSVNLGYFYVNFLVLVFGCRKFLIQSLRQTHLPQLILGVVQGFAINYLGNILISTLMLALPDFTNPADATTTEMVLQDSHIMLVCAVLLGPIVEEILMRGLIFAPLSRRNRPAAYLVSALAFSALHLFQFVGSVPVGELLLSLLSYLPGSIALAYSYERGGTIWSPVILHTINNAMSLWALSLFS